MGDYSEELVELVARAQANAAWLGLTDEEWAALSADERSVHQRCARAILDALSSSGRLVPEGSEVREEWGIRWPSGDVLGCYASGDEARHIAGDRGIVLHSKTITTPWTPSEPAQEER